MTGAPYIGLFEVTGVMARPWAEGGRRCLVLDLANDDRERDGVFHGRCDLSSVETAIAVVAAFCAGERPGFIAAFPPCDDLAVSGARWFWGKGLGRLSEAIGLFAVAAAVCEHFGAPCLIENPVSTISSYWRKPDYSFHPHHFAGIEPGDNYTKKTCLWTGGGFVMPDRCPGIGSPDDRIHKAAPGPDRKAFRSATPLGFARAVFAANGGRA